MSDLYHGELPVDLTPAEAHEAIERLDLLDRQTRQKLAELTPSHPFTPDVVAWARSEVDRAGEEDWLYGSFVPAHVKAARQILAVVERG